MAVVLAEVHPLDRFERPGELFPVAWAEQEWRDTAHKSCFVQSVEEFA